MAGVVTVEMLNGQAGKLPVTLRGGMGSSDAAHGGPEGSDLSPWRLEMLPPGQPGTFGTQRQIPTGGEIHIAQDASGYRMFPKEITPDHDGRQLPYEGDVSFNKMRLPVESYRTRAEAFKSVPYWDVKPVLGPEDWPSRKLFPSQPNMEVVDSIEQDIMPLPFTQDNQRGYSVMDIDMNFDPDAIGLSGFGDHGVIDPETMAKIAINAVLDAARARGISVSDRGMSGLGLTAEEIKSMTAQADALEQSASMFKATGMTAEANSATAAAKALRVKLAAEKPGWLDSAINAVAGLATQYLTLQTIKKTPTQYIPGTTTPIPPGVKLVGGTYVSDIEEPFYTKPSFLVLAALGLVGGGYLLLKK